MSSHGDEPPAAESVDHLDAGGSGRWLIRSRGTTHLLDLDRRIYERRTGPTSQHFSFDNVPMELARVVVWPRVDGRMLVFFYDPREDNIEYWRLTSRIRSITPDLGDEHLPEDRSD